MAEDSPEERRRRQTENARERQGLPPLPTPMSALDAGPAAAKDVRLVDPQQQLQIQGQGKDGDMAAKLETLTRNMEKLTRDVAEILAVVKDIKANPPYAMLG